MHKLLVCACISQDIAQDHKKNARSHDSETVTFKNSGFIQYNVASCLYTSEDN